MFTLAAIITVIGFALVWALVFTMLGDAWPRLAQALHGQAAPQSRSQPLVASRRFMRA
ncbi:MAG: hypothetical protein WCO82_05615 [Sphingomonadales bacterium]|jgi:uncharacterized membrane protein YagU involved in acid resistance